MAIPEGDADGPALNQTVQNICRPIYYVDIPFTKYHTYCISTSLGIQRHVARRKMRRKFWEKK